jgi:hypothetical protein
MHRVTGTTNVRWVPLGAPSADWQITLPDDTVTCWFEDIVAIVPHIELLVDSLPPR